MPVKKFFSNNKALMQDDLVHIDMFRTQFNKCFDNFQLKKVKGLNTALNLLVRDKRKYATDIVIGSVVWWASDNKFSFNIKDTWVTEWLRFDIPLEGFIYKPAGIMLEIDDKLHDARKIEIYDLWDVEK